MVKPLFLWEKALKTEFATWPGKSLQEKGLDFLDIMGHDVIQKNKCDA
jgi:hypothetical protein